MLISHPISRVKRPVPAGIGRAENRYHGDGEGAGGLKGEGIAADEERSLLKQGHDLPDGEKRRDGCFRSARDLPGQPQFRVISPEKERIGVFALDGLDDGFPFRGGPSFGFPGRAHVADDELLAGDMADLQELRADVFPKLLRNLEGEFVALFIDPQRGEEPEVFVDKPPDLSG